LITQVWEHLYIGSLNDAERLTADNPASITTVVSLCPEDVLPKAKGIKYEGIPIPDAQPISAAQFEEIMKTLAEQIRRGAVSIDGFRKNIRGVAAQTTTPPVLL
jgi:hypothetical protein